MVDRRRPCLALIGAFGLGLAPACGSAHDPEAGAPGGGPAGASDAGSNTTPPPTSTPPTSTPDATADARTPLPECGAQRVVHLVGGFGGLAWFTLVWPAPAVITG